MRRLSASSSSPDQHQQQHQQQQEQGAETGPIPAVSTTEAHHHESTDQTRASTAAPWPRCLGAFGLIVERRR
ncbi:Uu.00g089250.m01.CDS01 [Anthostomella pinea]|uniref:Uu.00g089250.m01.CDS01 n=1 Tax=Anthostomella pinea TaxID=933095 RepID=A0AAI8YHR9_9PEZI|nr:Uu.00g089250.m01.CDS01 [Anthostomella pinea]